MCVTHVVIINISEHLILTLHRDLCKHNLHMYVCTQLRHILFIIKWNYLNRHCASKGEYLGFFGRMKLCCLLPKVKSTLKIPTDKHLLQQLELCMRKLLCQEKDKDVLTIVKRVSIFLFKQHLFLGLSLKVKMTKVILFVDFLNVRMGD